MKYSARIILSFLSLAILFLIAPACSQTQAATYSLRPTENIVPKGWAFTISVDMYSDEVDIKGGDASIQFDPAYLEILAVTRTPWFDILASNVPAVGGTLYIRQAKTDPSNTISGSGRVATIALRGRRPGVTTLKFLCEVGNKNDTNLWDANGQDVADCSKIANKTFTITIVGEGEWPGGKYIGKDELCDLCGKCKSPRTGEITQPPDWEKCRECLYDTDGNVKKGYYWTGLGCTSTQAGAFIQILLLWLFRLAGGIVFLLILYAASLILTSRGNQEQLTKGKRLLTGAVIGLFIFLFAVFIIRLVGVDILGLPGFGN